MARHPLHVRIENIGESTLSDFVTAVAQNNAILKGLREIQSDDDIKSLPQGSTGKLLKTLHAALPDANSPPPKFDELKKDCKDKINSALDNIAKNGFTGLDYNQLQTQFKTFIRVLQNRWPQLSKNLKEDRDRWSIKTLPNSLEGCWGSKRQIGCGWITVNLLHFYGLSEVKLHPIWGAILLPTGGIVGPGDTNLYRGNINDGLVMHACVHDSFGYVLRYHDKGPGYNYLQATDAFPTTNPLSGQASGALAAWYFDVTGSPSRPFRFLDLAGTQADLKSKL